MGMPGNAFRACPAQAPPGASTENFVGVMAPGLVGAFKAWRPRVLIPPNVAHLAEEFPLKMLDTTV
jgi:hypothetical protein